MIVKENSILDENNDRLINIEERNMEIIEDK